MPMQLSRQSRIEVPLELTLQDIKPPSEWVSKKVRMSCADCGLKFNNLFRRRHHCRLCGDLFCKQCILHQRLRVPQSTFIKICRYCAFSYNRHSPTRSTSSSILSRRSIPSKTSNEMEKMSKSCRGRITSEPSTSLPSPPHTHGKQDEASRLLAVRRYDTSSTSTNLQVLCKKIAAKMECPMAFISMIDEHDQLFKAKVGLTVNSLPRTNVSMCEHVVTTGVPLDVLDTLQDPRFRHTTLVTDFAVRFYAGMPIIDSQGNVIGTIAALDYEPRTSCNMMALGAVATGVMLSLQPKPKPKTYYQSAPEPTTQLTKFSSFSAPSSPRITYKEMNDSDALMMGVLAQSATTQTALANQHEHMVHTMSTHSQLLDNLTRAIHRMESKLSASDN